VVPIFVLFLILYDLLFVSGHERMAKRAFFHFKNNSMNRQSGLRKTLRKTLKSGPSVPVSMVTNERRTIDLAGVVNEEAYRSHARKKNILLSQEKHDRLPR